LVLIAGAWLVFGRIETALRFLASLAVSVPCVTEVFDVAILEMLAPCPGIAAEVLEDPVPSRVWVIEVSDFTVLDDGF
jgi:hypothetical protein